MSFWEALTGNYTRVDAAGNVYHERVMPNPDYKGIFSNEPALIRVLTQEQAKEKFVKRLK